MIHSHGQIKSGHLSELDAAVLRQAENAALVLVQGTGLWNLPPLMVDAVLATRSGSTLPFYRHVEQQKYRYFVSV